MNNISPKNQTMPYVLVADDDEDILNIVTSAIEGVDCQVVKVKNGKEAKEQLNNIEFDLLVLDLMMPHVDGATVCRDFKNTDSGKITPVLILTAKLAIQDKVDAFADGADDYLTKPFNYYELQSRVKALLRIRQMNLALKSKNDELVKLQEKLIEQERQLAVQQLAGSAAHNLGQPLTAMQLNLYCLKEINQNDPTWLQAFEAIKADLKRAIEQIEQLKNSNANKKSDYHKDLQIIDI
jgi:DNA-binding response OmpR family regulator